MVYPFKFRAVQRFNVTFLGRVVRRGFGSDWRAFGRSEGGKSGVVSPNVAFRGV